MLKIIGGFFLRLILISLGLALLHWGVVHFAGFSLSREALFAMHIFIVGLTLVSYTAVVLVWKASYDIVAFGFLGISLLKMFASLAYLWPLIRSEGPDVESKVINFFVAYFIYLFVEALEVMKLLKNKPSGGASEKE